MNNSKTYSNDITILDGLNDITLQSVATGYKCDVIVRYKDEEVSINESPLFNRTAIDSCSRFSAIQLGKATVLMFCTTVHNYQHFSFIMHITVKEDKLSLALLNNPVSNEDLSGDIVKIVDNYIALIMPNDINVRGFAAGCVRIFNTDILRLYKKKLLPKYNCDTGFGSYFKVKTVKGKTHLLIGSSKEDAKKYDYKLPY